MALVPCLDGGAHLAPHVAAPLERAAAPLPRHVRLRLEPSTAAHQVAAVHPDGGDVALPALRALVADVGVAVAEGGGLFVVDEVTATWALVAGVDGMEDEAPSLLAAHVAFVPWEGETHMLRLKG